MGVKVNMNNIKLISSAVAIAIGLGACSNKESITANPQIVYQTNTVSKQIEQIPEWYLNIPSADDTLPPFNILFSLNSGCSMLDLFYAGIITVPPSPGPISFKANKIFTCEQ